MNRITTKFIKTAKNLECYTMDAESILFFTIVSKIQEKFDLEAPTLPIYGLDGTYLDLNKGDIRITMMWDIWTEFSIFCHDNKSGATLIRDIGQYLDTILDELFEIEQKLLKEAEESKKIEE